MISAIEESTLILVGGSVRAAAGSAIRAGLRPWCADRYGDSDMAAMAVNHPPLLQAGFADLPAIFASAPDIPWAYTGCLENYPNLIAELAAVRPLWGNDRPALVASRSPFHIFQLLQDAELPALQVRHVDGELTDVHSWVRKPIQSCGGQGIELVRPEDHPERDERYYFQEFAFGTPMSAMFVRARGNVTLIGVTEQLVGLEPIEWLHAPPFTYAGSIGPVEPPDAIRRELARIGEVIGEGCQLRGLFGVDFVLRDDRPWVVEVNPRYTASVEILERALGIQTMSLHRTEFDPDAPSATVPNAGKRWVGKAIVYAPKTTNIRYSHAFRETLEAEIRAARTWQPIHYADLQRNETMVACGCPILTVLAEEATRSQCEFELHRRANWVLGQIAGDREPGAPPRVANINWSRPLNEQDN